MKGYEVGLNEWPQRGRLMHRGGSISSLPKSTNLDVLEAPSSVLFFDLAVLSNVDCNCLVLK